MCWQIWKYRRQYECCYGIEQTEADNRLVMWADEEDSASVKQTRADRNGSNDSLRYSYGIFLLLADDV